ncbi:HIT family protein [Tessaracoccus palaemonis]|uniref:HIT domain-containing protein n=1 Tax=Tessaracoccus palaemonis TaxID=2829499 RepID=A0ABX8SNE3_9ACTN|nr:HIT domain-containing protein [Tessaracoccus palaemonis]QXT63915.1 HIT domain-containing protein [Tessaracoccus palaemonis]
MDCLFCAIVAGDIGSKRVYEDEACFAFLDINPWQVGHTLVIPRRHVVDALADDEVLVELGPSVARVGRLLKERLGADAVNIVSNAGAASGQEVFHAHVHVLPRWADNPGVAHMKTEVTEPLDEVWRRIVG